MMCSGIGIDIGIGIGIDNVPCRAVPYRTMLCFASKPVSLPAIGTTSE